MMCVRVLARVAAVALPVVAPSIAAAQTWDPHAFGPLGGLPANQYFSRVVDISGDGFTFVGQTNLGTIIYRTPGIDYSMSGIGGAFALARNGQTAVGGLSGQAPQRWDIANAVGSSIASQTITWPGGPQNIGPAYNANSNATAFGMASPTSVITSSGLTSANSVFQSMGGSAGAYRGIAADAPIMVVLATLPGNPTNAYRWNFSNDLVEPLNMPAGASSIEAGSVGGSVSGDASRVGGYAVLGTVSRPCWWDADGAPHLVPLFGTALGGAMTAMNYTGTLGGGSMLVPGQGNRAFLAALDSDTVYDLNAVYSSAGLLPAGWTLLTTQHISDDGSRIFCLATAPDGSNRIVLLEGDFTAPAPAAGGLLALAGLFASRRRR